MTKNTKIFLLVIFGIAVVLRFLYFPKDIYFSYDQARDAFISLKAMAGDVKIAGPPATFQGVNHGALFYYIFGPLYLIAGGSPVGVSVFLRIFNALGIFLIFAISQNLFKDKTVGLIAAALFAFSFEQTQYALFIGHPSMGVIAVLLFYLGLAQLIFGRKQAGLILALSGLGLAIQFHFAMINLAVVLMLIGLVFRRDLPKVSARTITLALAGFAAAAGSYVVAELKFGFTTTKAIVNFFTNSEGGANFYPENWVFVIGRFVHDNLAGVDFLTGIVGVICVICLFYFLFINGFKKQVIFLAIWLVGGIVPYALGASAITVYYYSIGGSLALILVFSYFVSKVLKSSRLLAGILLCGALLSNVSLIKTYNPTGTIAEINVQDRMLLSDEKAVVDYIYTDAQNREFSVNALTIPYNVNTTWAYVFEWYGYTRYRRLPIWGGNAADGFEGDLKVVSAQSELPQYKYLIFEPERGMPPGLKDTFLAEEDLYWRLVDQKTFGAIAVQKREKI